MIKGFSTTQAEKLLKEYGLNVIQEQKRKNILIVFFEQFNNFLTLLLLFAALLSFFIGEPIDGGLIMSIVILNAMFGIYQEHKASEAIAALKKMTVSRVRVIRDGKETEIDSRYLVPGDVMFVEEGVKVPADGKMIEVINLQINESALTGESLPISKSVDDEIYMGTIVSRGRGYVEVTGTGMHTKFGQIAANLSQIEDTQTPLQKKLEDLSKTIGIFGIIISVIVFGLSLMDGSGYFPAFLLAISLAVAVVPEGLPAVMTITLAVGVKEMARRKAIVRKLSAIEALGSITLIATDKTGTLTANKMKVKEIFSDGRVHDENNLPSLMSKPFSTLVLNGVLCSTANLVYVHDAGHFDVLGDPTEGALLYLAQKVGLMPDMIRKQWHLVEEVPFDSETKMMTVTMKKDKEVLTLRKGALESIIPLCNHVMEGDASAELTQEKIAAINKVADEWAGRGLRVLAFSYSHGFSETEEPKHIFLGMVAIHDPPRIESRDAIKRAFEAGIKVVMITGDNERTAEAIGVSVGLIHEGEEILTGKQVEESSDEELLKILPNVRIFARTTPFHKSRIVQLYQKLGEIVVVTGDGVNDAIALKQADVGVAMGLVGTDVARETADMVITDDNFATIVNAIEEGRNIIRNLKNAIKYLLSCNVSEAISLVIGLSVGLPNLFVAIQLLYINLVTDGVPALALAFSPREEHIMRKSPERKLFLLNRFDKLYIFLVGSLATALVISSYILFKFEGEAVAKTAAFTVLALVQSFIFVDVWLSHRSLRKHFSRLRNPMFIVAFLVPFLTQGLILTVPFVAGLFKITIVPIYYYAAFIVMSFLILLCIKVVKITVK